MSARAAQLNLFADAPTPPAEPTPPTAPATRKSATVPSQVQPGDLWQLGRHRLLCGDSTRAADVARLLAGERAALLVADPPYGMGIDTWDRPLPDIAGWLRMARGWLAADAFLALFQQMPTALDWLIPLHGLGTSYRFRDHVVWVKRQVTGIALPLNRSHESLYLYTLGNPRYAATKGRYEDVKIPGVLMDIATLDALHRYIADMRTKLAGTWKPIHDNGKHHPVHRWHTANPATHDRSAEYANFTNVWSFLPANNKRKGSVSGSHATAKPTLLLARLVELCTAPDALVLDTFLGSGTTLIVCERTGRTCYGIEREPTYCDAVLARWEAATGQHAVCLSREEVSA